MRILGAKKMREKWRNHRMLLAKEHGYDGGVGWDEGSAASYAVTAIALGSFAVFRLVRTCARWVKLSVAGAGQVGHTQAPSALIKVGKWRTWGHWIWLLKIENIPKGKTLATVWRWITCWTLTVTLRLCVKVNQSFAEQYILIPPFFEGRRVESLWKKIILH